jgi:hypothetical protein
MSENDCKHEHRVGDNYGVSCVDCGVALEGYGYWGEASKRCVKHLWLDDGNGGECCMYCELWREKEGTS